MDDLSPAELREVRKAIRAAYERGRAAERREFDAFLARMRALKELNGSGDAFLKAWEESKHPRDHGKFSSAPGGKGDDKAADRASKPDGDSSAPPPRVRPDPNDWTREDWEHAPTDRSANRWRNAYTGKVAYGPKPPRGRTEAQRRADAERRAARLKEPARFDRDAAARLGDWEARTGMTADEALAVADGAGGSVVGAAWTADPGDLALVIDHPDATDWVRRVVLDPDGGLTLKNVAFFLRPNAQGSGVGTDVFASQVRGCVAAGVSRVTTCAGRGTLDGVPMNGYYTWPLLGYDAPLTGAQKKKLPPDLRGAETVQDLYATPAGKEWWRENGVTTAMEFDVSPGSRSLAVLNAYLAARGKPAVEYPPDRHAANEARRRDRAGRPGRAAAEAAAARAHAEYAGRARAAGFDPGEIRAAAESYPAAEAPSLDAAYTRAMQEAGERRFEARWAAESAAREEGRRLCAEYGLPADEVERMAVRAALRDSRTLNNPDAHDAVRSAVVAAAQRLHYHRTVTGKAGGND